MTCWKLVCGLRQPIIGCNELTPKRKDGCFLPLRWVFHDECTSVYGYTLDKTYIESWHKVIKLLWLHQATSICCLSTFREYWIGAKVSSDIDLQVRS